MNSPVPCQCGKRFKSQSAIAQHVRDSPRHGPSTASAPSNAGPGPATASPTQLPPPPQDNIVGTGKMTCACGKVVKGASGLHDHMRDSPRHAAAKNNASKKPSTSTSSATLAKSTPKRSTPPKSAVSTPHPPATPAPTEKTSNAVKNSKKEKKAAKEKGVPNQALGLSVNKPSTSAASASAKQPTAAEPPVPAPASIAAGPSTSVLPGFVREGTVIETKKDKKKDDRKKKPSFSPIYYSSGEETTYGGWTDCGDKANGFGLCDKDCGWCGHCMDNVDVWWDY